MTTDGQLLERLKFRDRTALESIYDEYYLLLWKACYRKFNDQAECERVLTEVFRQLWECPQQFSGDRRLVFYLIECTNNTMARLKRETQCQ
ncbi:hypothetical protein BBI15_10450 [Planococcus plakortidis]|uniref:RNA polymerase sigma-70 region 2 domain-containing protein n=1 Tax=Planococcus plakortidis TaxID=1038856 RepID=A0A1C7EAZ5_9BACL|nr:hypothetical protein BBI15_10450 [Planococcus plakortidis]